MPARGSAYNQHKAQALRPPFGGLFAWTHREAAQLFDSLFWAFGALVKIKTPESAGS
jgi:hypothetical protein